MKKNILTLLLGLLSIAAVMAHDVTGSYNRERPLIVAGDWDKPPYEYLNDEGQPAGINIDILRTICDELGIPCRFLLKEWSSAVKAFERGDADIILADRRRFRKGAYCISENIIIYNRIYAATLHDSIDAVSLQQLAREGVAIKPGDFATLFIQDIDSLSSPKIEYQSPAVALQGVLSGDYRFFAWGEEPLRWKVKELQLDGIVLNEVELPVCEIHIVGRDRRLIDAIDDHYSRLKQSGDVQRISDSWLHPERVEKTSPSWIVYTILAILALAATLYVFARVAKTHVRIATRESRELTDMLNRAMQMDSGHAVEHSGTDTDLKANYERLLKTSHTGISFYDKDGWLVDLNDAMKTLCGISDGDAQGMRYWSAMNMFDIPLFRQTFTAGMKEEVCLCQHITFDELHIDRYIELRIRPLLDERGNVALYFISATDVGEARRLDRMLHQQRHALHSLQQDIVLYRQWLDLLNQLENTFLAQEAAVRQRLEKERQLAEESVRLKSGFMTSMTHELRTPLNAIIGFTDILFTIDSAEERAELLRIIHTNCDMLQRLINDILTASSFSEGPTTIEAEDVDFSKEFNDICVMLQQRVGRNVDFIRENPYHTFYTHIDKGRIAQVMVNFVTNAVKFTREGYIKVGYSYEHGGLRIYCTDTGVGIAKDKQDIIFERFVKLDEFVQGTGMGLNICKSIAERCKGEIGVISEGEGKGSTFWIWIPCERKATPEPTPNINN